MIYGQDSPIAFPVADLYDTGVMQMYLSAVRDLYQQGLKDYENFISKYGDFTSPFAKDVDKWNNDVMGPTMNLIDALYAQGIDPMRNAEARAMIQRSVRNVPYAEAAKMKLNAAAGEAYLKARGALAAKGLYDKDYNDFWLTEQGYKPFEEWSSEDGIWNVTSPIEYKSLFDATSPWFEKMQKHDLTKKQVLDAKYPYDPKYRYTGIPVEDLQEVTGRSLPGFMNSFEGRYYRKTVADRLAAAGIEPTDEAVNEALANDIVTANHRVVVDPIAEEDRYALADYEDKLERGQMEYKAKLDEAQAARDHERQLELYGIRYGDEDSTETSSSSSSRSGRGGGTGSGLSTVPLGAADQLMYDQRGIFTDNYANSIKEHEADKKAAYQKQVDAFNKLTPSDKEVAKLYGKYFRILYDKNSTEALKSDARKHIDRFDKKKDQNFLNWVGAFTNRMTIENIGDESYFNKKYTTEGRAGYKEQSDVDLRRRAKEIFDDNHKVKNVTNAQRNELNSVLNYSQVGDIRHGKMNSDRDVLDITIALMTGNRRYRYNSVPKKVSRIIKDKQFLILPDNLSTREYGAGYIGKKHYNVINEVATFFDDDVVKQLDAIGEETLNKYGITKIEKEGKKGYNIPITTKTGRGQARADINSATAKRLGGTTTSAGLMPIYQATEEGARLRETLE